MPSFLFYFAVNTAFKITPIPVNHLFEGNSTIYKEKQQTQQWVSLSTFPAERSSLSSPPFGPLIFFSGESRNSDILRVSKRFSSFFLVDF